jgi:hypothetical protein
MAQAALAAPDAEPEFEAAMATAADFVKNTRPTAQVCDSRCTPTRLLICPRCTPPPD